MPSPIRIAIMGAAGRDFHNFNVVFRGNPDYQVVAFTAAQIPGIAGRRYPPALCGAGYPQGIPIVDESGLEKLCREERIDQVVFAYSDVPHAWVMHKASLALAAGADFLLLGPQHTMLASKLPVIAISAVRTGCGKSQTSRWLSRLLKEQGLRVAVIRHPMPYGNLEKQAVQHFASRADLDAAECTVEEREEYEPHLRVGNVVYAGVDYAAILALAETEADIILWEGGNNDFPFIRPNLHLVLVDPLRAGHETSHHPGEAVLRMADIVIVMKVNTASEEDIRHVSESVRLIRPDATLLYGLSLIELDDAAALRGKKALVIEDGPTITHGGMAYGAGLVAAQQAGAAAIVDPRAGAAEPIAAVYARYPHIGPVLPALGYSPAQLRALRDTINAADAEVVVAATPCDLAALIRIDKPLVRARYEFAEARPGELSGLITDFLRDQGAGTAI